MKAQSQAPPVVESWDIGRGLRGYLWRSSNPRGNLLLQHGFAEYSERYVAHYNRLIPRLLELGLNVYAFDLRGHGNSPGARGVVDVDQAIEDHRVARSLLAAEQMPLFLFGHSLGGLVTAASICQDKRGVAGVVLSAPALATGVPAAVSFVLAAFTALASALRLTPALDANMLTRIPEEVAAYERDPLIRSARISFLLVSSAMAVGRETEARYAEWKAPVLIMHGAMDRAADPKGSQRLFSSIASTDKHLEIYPDGRHELLNDLDRETALALLLSWFRARLAGGNAIAQE